jgi:hypothetical protein
MAGAELAAALAAALENIRFDGRSPFVNDLVETDHRHTRYRRSAVAAVAEGR